MTTILKEIEVSGNGLMKNRPCTVQLMPSKEGCIRFFVKNSHTPIILDVDNVLSTTHCIVLGNNRKDTLMLTEHFTAACAVLGIDSLDVHVSAPEIPILDGSAKEWVEIFNQAGVERVRREKITISEPVYYLNGKTHMVILPDEDLFITYAVNYNHPDLTNKWVSFDKKTINEIIEARTFGFLKDLKKYQLFGYAKGVSYDNTVGLDGDGYTTELRSQCEPIKHKILDLLGDLYLSGANPLNLKAQIIVKEAGHAVHVKVAKKLKQIIAQNKEVNKSEILPTNLEKNRFQTNKKLKHIKQVKTRIAERIELANEKEIEQETEVIDMSGVMSLADVAMETIGVTSKAQAEFQNENNKNTDEVNRNTCTTETVNQVQDVPEEKTTNLSDEVKETEQYSQQPEVPTQQKTMSEEEIEKELVLAREYEPEDVNEEKKDEEGLSEAISVLFGDAIAAANMVSNAVPKTEPNVNLKTDLNFERDLAPEVELIELKMELEDRINNDTNKENANE